MGDLVADRRLGRPDFDGARAASKTASYWRNVHAHTGQPWPVHLQWTPLSSGHACRAVKAAQQQDDMIAAAFLRAIRESCFVYGTPADTVERLLALAATVGGIDVDRLASDFEDDGVAEAFTADRDETRRPNDYVVSLRETHEGKGNAKPDGDGWRYVFPTLLFRGPGGEHTVPGWQPWEAYVDAMEAADRGSTGAPRPDPTPDEALAEWPLVTAKELAVLCGEHAEPPAGVQTVDWGAGLAYKRA